MAVILNRAPNTEAPEDGCSGIIMTYLFEAKEVNDSDENMVCMSVLLTA